jgi:hypothetical protein
MLLFFSGWNGSHLAEPRLDGKLKEDVSSKTILKPRAI